METKSVTSPQKATESVADRLRKIKRGAEPIPGFLPLVGVGIPGPLLAMEQKPKGNDAKTETVTRGYAYKEEDLIKLKEMGLNTMMTDFYVKAEITGSSPLPLEIDYDFRNITSSFENGKKTGMRIIPGITLTDPMHIDGPSYSESIVNQMKRTIRMNLVQEYSNAKGCPAWFLNEQPSVAGFESLANMSNAMFLKDKWQKPILFKLKPSDSEVSDFTGGDTMGWTANNAFSRYRTLLDYECPPSVWWVTDRAFSDLYTDTGALPKTTYLKALKDVMDHIRPKALDITPRYNSMWATVHCSFKIPTECIGKDGKEIPQEYLDLMKLRMGLEARCALALGAKGLVFDRLCGSLPIDEWCPAKQWEKISNPGVNHYEDIVWEAVENPMGDLVKDLTKKIQKVADTFIGTELVETCVFSTLSTLKNTFGEFFSGFGPMTHIEPSGTGNHLLISRFVNRNGNKEYVVIVNLNPAQSVSLDVAFDEEMQNLNPGTLLSISPVSPVLPPTIGPLAEPTAETTDDISVPSPNYGSEKSIGKEFELKIAAGDWRIFSRSRSLSEFGVNQK